MVITKIDCKPGSGPIVPDYCEILVDRRMVHQQTMGKVLDEMDGLTENAEVEIVVDEVTCYTGENIKNRQFFPGWLTDPDHWLVKKGRNALEIGLGKKPKIIGWEFSTDGVATAGQLDIPTIGFGPGNPALAHQPNEHISITDVTKAARGFNKLAESLTSVK
jgi:acetylornithine deacetylase/succinyl-diaminopimelate desuccinylase-like protein